MSQGKEHPAPREDFNPRPAFVGAMRGYDKRQVDDYVAQVERQLGALMEERKRGFVQIQELARQLQKSQSELADLRQRPPQVERASFRDLGPMVDQILALAEKQAETINAAATEQAGQRQAKADKVLIDARQQADELRAAGEAAREQAMQEAARLTEENAAQLAKAREEAAAQAEAARAKLQEELDAARARSDEALAQLKAAAEQEMTEARNETNQKNSALAAEAQHYATDLRRRAEEAAAMAQKQLEAVQQEIQARRQVASQLNTELGTAQQRLMQVRHEGSVAAQELQQVQERLSLATQELTNQLARLDDAKKAADSAEKHAKEVRARVQREAERVANLAAAAVMAAAARGHETGEYPQVVIARPEGGPAASAVEGPEAHTSGQPLLSAPPAGPPLLSADAFGHPTPATSGRQAGMPGPEAAPGSGGLRPAGQAPGAGAGQPLPGGFVPGGAEGGLSQRAPGGGDGSDGGFIPFPRNPIDSPAPEPKTFAPVPVAAGNIGFEATAGVGWAAGSGEHGLITPSQQRTEESGWAAPGDRQTAEPGWAAHSLATQRDGLPHRVDPAWNQNTAENSLVATAAADESADPAQEAGFHSDPATMPDALTARHHGLAEVSGADHLPSEADLPAGDLPRNEDLNARAEGAFTAGGGLAESTDGKPGDGDLNAHTEGAFAAGGKLTERIDGESGHDGLNVRAEGAFTGGGKLTESIDGENDGLARNADGEQGQRSSLLGLPSRWSPFDRAAAGSDLADRLEASVDLAGRREEPADASGHEASGGPDMSGPDMSGPDMSCPDMSGPDMSGQSTGGQEPGGPAISGRDVRGQEASGMRAERSEGAEPDDEREADVQRDEAGRWYANGFGRRDLDAQASPQRDSLSERTGAVID